MRERCKAAGHYNHRVQSMQFNNRANAFQMIKYLVFHIYIYQSANVFYQRRPRMRPQRVAKVPTLTHKCDNLSLPTPVSRMEKRDTKYTSTHVHSHAQLDTDVIITQTIKAHGKYTYAHAFHTRLHLPWCAVALFASLSMYIFRPNGVAGFGSRRKRNKCTCAEGRRNIAQIRFRR